MEPAYENNGSIRIYCGDVLAVLPQLDSESVNCCVTSPPYWGLRDYGHDGQIGLERTPEEYIARMVEVFREVKRVLREDGTLWLNIGDSYAGNNAPGWREENEPKNGGVSNKNGVGFVAGCKPKDLVGIPWMLAFALRTDGWYLRSDIIWSKPNPMPESVTDRPTKAHEYIFLLSKSQQYYYDQEAILEPVSLNTHLRLSQNLAAQIGSWRANGGGKTNGPMKAVNRKAALGEIGVVKSNVSFESSVCLPVEERNKRSVWTVNAQGFSEAHFATFPEELIKPCILAGCPAGGTVLDPFMGSGTTGLVARNLQCKAVGIELNPEYIEIAAKRLRQEVFQF